jgi:hypothetical protein
MRVVFIYADSPSEWNCSEFRSLQPADAINTAAKNDPARKDWYAKLIHVSGFSDYLNPVIQDIVMRGDIIAFQRNLVTQQVFDAIEYWQGMGKPVIADLDDAYQILPVSNPAWHFWIENSSSRDPLPLVWLENGLKMCNGLTSPNRNILRDWSHVVKGYWLPNFARGEWWKDLPDHDAEKERVGLAGKTVIGWGGSVSHYDSWWGSGLREAATRICARHPEVVWMICGNDPRIAGQLPVPPLQKIQQPGVQPQDWPKIVNLFDIGVAPLFGIYDQHRSWIKGMEYSLAGVPWIGTRGEPYSDIAALGTLIGNSTDAWEMEIEGKLANLKAERELSRARVPAAQQGFLIENQLDVYDRVYKSIINEFQGGGRLAGIYHVAQGAAQEGKPS